MVSLSVGHAVTHNSTICLKEKGSHSFLVLVARGMPQCCSSTYMVKAFDRSLPTEMTMHVMCQGVMIYVPGGYDICARGL